MPARESNVKIEREYKFNVPDNMARALWHHMRRHFDADAPFMTELGEEWSVAFAEEHFVDHYYDSADFRLCDDDGALRYRTRYFPDNPEHPKHAKGAIHLKLASDVPEERLEVKFKAAEQSQWRSLLPHSPMALVLPEQREDFLVRMEDLGIDPAELRKILRIYQVRERVYLYHNDEPWINVTLDSVVAGKLWRSLQFIELEVELDDDVYTKASAKKQKQMDAVAEAIVADLRSRFPGLKADYRSKYQIACRYFDRHFPLFNPLVRYNVNGETLMVAGGALSVLFLLWLCFKRRD